MVFDLYFQYVTTLGSLYGLCATDIIDVKLVMGAIQGLDIDAWVNYLHLDGFVHVPEVILLNWRSFIFLYFVTDVFFFKS